MIHKFIATQGRRKKGFCEKSSYRLNTNSLFHHVTQDMIFKLDAGLVTHSTSIQLNIVVVPGKHVLIPKEELALMYQVHIKKKKRL